jgi:hypothetical protein
MDSIDLGTIKNVPIQEVWRREASDFTPWLARNLSYLSDKLGIELSPENTEVRVGDFSADIVARDLSTSRFVIIENQYGQSDHKHLGQVITYAAGRGASAVIWVAEQIRPEHRVAIDLLNRGMKSVLRFYAVEASVIQIDNSRPAFTLDVICEPEEDEIETQSPDGGERNERYQKYLVFFQGLIDELNHRHFTRARKAQPQNWYTFHRRIRTYSPMRFHLLSIGEFGPRSILTLETRRKTNDFSTYCSRKNRLSNLQWALSLLGMKGVHQGSPFIVPEALIRRQRNCKRSKRGR